MKNSKLIKLLKLFDPRETRQLRKFVHKMNSDEALTKLFEYLVKQAPEYEYNKEQCYKLVYPGRDYNDSNLRKLFARGIQITEQFIVSKRMEESEVLKNRALTEFYQEKEATALWEKQITKWEKANQESDWNYHFLEKIRIAEYQFRYESIQLDRKITYKKSKVQQEALSNLLIVFEQFIIRYLFCLKNVTHNTNDNYYRRLDLKFPVIDLFIKGLSKLDETDKIRYQKSHFALYYSWKLHELFTTGNYDLYKEVEQFLYKNHQRFPTFNKLEITSSLIHYCFLRYQKMNRIDRKNPIDSFNMHLFMLEQKICYQGKYLLPVAYISMFNLAFDCGKFDWLKTFIDTYSKDLPPEEQFYLVNYTKAFYHFQIRAFSQSIKHAELLEKNNNYFYDLESKVRLLQAYYEVEHDRFENSLNSLRVTLFRDRKLVDQKIEEFKAFVSFLYQIYNCPKRAKENLKELRLQLTTADPIAKREWLLEKIDEKLGIDTSNRRFVTKPKQK